MYLFAEITKAQINMATLYDAIWTEVQRQVIKILGSRTYQTMYSNFKHMKIIRNEIRDTGPIN